VQVTLEQVQPVPDMETRVRPEGIVSVTVMVPLVGATEAALDTVTL
jgi:hypothetical protein